MYKRQILQGVSSNSCNLQDTVNNISSSTKTEKDKVKDLKKLNKKIGEFISVTVKKDNSVKEQIEKTKEEFYTCLLYTSFIAIRTLPEKEDKHRKEASTQKEKRSFGLKIRRKPKTDN